MANLSEKYKCPMCLKVFDHRQGYWRHKNTNKKPCVTKDRLNEIFEEKKKENEKLKRQEIENKILQHKLKLMEERLKKQEQPQTIVNNITNNNIVVNNNFNITFTLPGDEKIEHISSGDLQSILDESDINNVLKRIVEQVFFHPSVPENMKWCVFDKNALNGALNFNHDENSITKVNTNDTINEHMQNLLGTLMIKFGDLSDKGELTKHQNRNYNRLGHLLGGELKTDQLCNVKDVAHNRQQHPKALWESLKLKLIDEFKSKQKY